MNDSVPFITFDSRGNCNYCNQFLLSTSISNRRSRSHPHDDAASIVAKIKSSVPKRSKYNCIIGVSGGVDSSWTLAKAVELGLRPLAVHMDNGWDSDLAQANISNLVRALNVDLYTHVIDWSEYRSLMQSFFDSDVIDIELLYDNAMLAVNYACARKYKVKYILSGDNTTTEGMSMPQGWNWFKYDKANIYDIASGVAIKSFPAIGTLDYVLSRHLLGIKWLRFPDYFDFSKNLAVNQLVDSYGYRPYPYKHYESVFTRFYQGYILPKKFNVDKRLLHLSTLIISGELSRSHALQMLEQSPYPNPDSLEQDILYFLKKMMWSRQDLENYLARPPRPHQSYKSELPIYEFLYKKAPSKLPPRFKRIVRSFLT